MTAPAAPPAADYLKSGKPWTAGLLRGSQFEPAPRSGKVSHPGEPELRPVGSAPWPARRAGVWTRACSGAAREAALRRRALDPAFAEQAAQSVSTTRRAIQERRTGSLAQQSPAPQ